MVNNGMKRAKILLYILTLGFITPIGIIVGMVLTLQAENAADTTQSMAVGVLQVAFNCQNICLSVCLSVCPSVRHLPALNVLSNRDSITGPFSNYTYQCISLLGVKSSCWLRKNASRYGAFLFWNTFGLFVFICIIEPKSTVRVF
jgi:hypothetical protein